MSDAFSGVITVIVMLALMYFGVWLYVLLPADMARDRNRDPLIWALISIVGSPLLAILLLIALGDAKA